MFTFVLLAQTHSTPLGQFIRLYGAKVNSSSSTTASSTVAPRKISNDGSSAKTFNAITREEQRNVLCHAESCSESSLGEGAGGVGVYNADQLAQQRV